MSRVQRGDFVAREPSSVGMKGRTAQSGKDIRPSSSRLQHPTGAGPASSRAGHFSSQPGQSGEAVHSGGPGLFGTSGQGSVHQASSSRASGSSHDTEQSSSSSTGRLHVRAGQSPAALHLRGSISGLLTSEQLPSQASNTTLFFTLWCTVSGIALVCMVGQQQSPETSPQCRNAFLSLDFQCRDDISDLKYTFWDRKELQICILVDAAQMDDALTRSPGSEVWVCLCREKATGSPALQKKEPSSLALVSMPKGMA